MVCSSESRVSISAAAWIRLQPPLRVLLQEAVFQLCYSSWHLWFWEQRTKVHSITMLRTLLNWDEEQQGVRGHKGFVVLLLNQGRMYVLYQSLASFSNTYGA